ncbi:MAG: hypothetical protein KHW62_06575 [Clostridiales bacterium]|nr:hypothetical protein [Clostridiales bacterium]
MRFRHYNKAIVPVIIAVFILRYAELSFLLEPGTAYYKTGDFYHYIFYIIYALAAIFFFMAYFFLPAKNCGGYIFENAAVYKYTSFFIPGFFLAVGSVIKLYQGFTSSDIIKFSYYFRTIDFYINIFSLIAAIALILFSVSAEKKLFKTTFFKVIIISLPISYILRLFDIYIESEEVALKTFGSFEVLKVAFMSLCLMSFSKIFISTCKRKNFTITLWLASIFTAVRVADMIFALINNQLNLMSIDIFYQIADADLILSLLFINTLLYKKRRRKIKKTDYNLTQMENNGEEKGSI